MRPMLLATYRSLLIYGFACAVFVSGCSSPLFQLRGQSPDAEKEADFEDVEKDTRLIADLTTPYNMRHLRVESVALVTGLTDTGSDPPPSPQRDMLIAEMQTHDIDPSPSTILRWPSTSMVIVRGYLPPGVQKGDHFDVDVYVPAGSRTTSLRGGWLMPSRMRELRMLNQMVRTGHVLALAGGPVMIDGLMEEGKSDVLERRGRVLGGGKALESRPLGLVVRNRESSIKTSAMIGTAINSRFHTFERTVQKEVATPKSDSFIELTVHPRYRNNLVRYMHVIGSIAIGERPAQRARRMQLLSRMLMEPTTAATAALQLEAIGHEAIPLLKKGLTSEEIDVQFYAAEALAYLDEEDAAKRLGEIAESEPAFRWHALTALSVMDHLLAYDALHDLLNSPSAETRYGAFRALRARNHLDPIVHGERLDDFAYHVISITGEPMVHLSWSKRPELVLFGHDQRLSAPAALFAGKSVLIRALPDGKLKVSRFAVGQEDQHEICSDRLDEVIRAVVKLGGSYDDVLQMLLDAQQRECLGSRLVVDALPHRGRQFRRASKDPAPDQEEASWTKVASPLPDLFRQDEAGSDGVEQASHVDDDDETADEATAEVEEQEPSEGFFGTITGWFTG